MFYVVTNSEVYHLTDLADEDGLPARDGSALCSFGFAADTASVVTEQPSPEHFRLCRRCEARSG